MRHPHHRAPWFPSRSLEAAKVFAKHSKADIWEAAMHLAALKTGEYDSALEDGRWLEELVFELDRDRRNRA